jgi:hypothetical protein
MHENDMQQEELSIRTGIKAGDDNGQMGTGNAAGSNGQLGSGNVTGSQIGSGY